MSAVKTPSKTTIRAYMKRAKQLHKRRFGKKKPSLQSILDTVTFLIATKPTLASSTWRQYKASLAWVLRNHVELKRHEWSRAESALAVLMAETQAGCLRRSNRTSSSKWKVFPEDDRNIITFQLESTRSIYADGLISIINAGVVSGLRPWEWAEARFYRETDGVLCLKVKNAKADDLRAHGEYRHLRWSSLDNRELAWIQTAVATLAEAKRRDRLQQYLKALQRLLRDTCRKIWPRRKRVYTLYDSRHEFAAHAKDWHSRDEVAALMGHATDETATQHYARARGGRDRPKWLPQPDPNEVVLVRPRFDRRYDRRSNRDGSGPPGFRF